MRLRGRSLILLTAEVISWRTAETADNGKVTERWEKRETVRIY